MNPKARKVLIVVALLLMVIVVIVATIAIQNHPVQKVDQTYTKKTGQPPPTPAEKDVNILDGAISFLTYLAYGIIAVIFVVPLICLAAQLHPIGYVFIPLYFYFMIFEYHKTVGPLNGTAAAIGTIIGAVMIIPLALMLLGSSKPKK
jgi:hypothetical protein